MKLNAFEKRIKRRVTAREHPFFAVCPPGLTQSCYNEITHLGLDPQKTAVTAGGINLLCKPDTCMELNLSLGIPSRILMRIGQFKATHFSQFEKKMATVEWDLYLPPKGIPNIKVHTKKSALYHSDALAQRAVATITKYLSPDKTDETNNSGQTIYIRADHDLFHVSLDTSGDLLFKRGIKTSVTSAPLRETLAFAMLGWTGFAPGDILIDPMCGCGTFSLEGAMIQMNIPPGFFRSFAFEAWPGFSNKTFAWLKKKAQTEFRTPDNPLIFASDIDKNAIKASADNFSMPNIAPAIHLEKTDFFAMSPDMAAGNRKGVIMLNPPYGKRLGKKKQTHSFYREIGKKLAMDFKGWRVGIILPDRKTYSDLGIKLALHPIFHGGLDVFAGIGRI